MKIVFFNIRDDEESFYQNALQGNEIDCFSESITPERLPLKRDYEVLSVFTDSKVDASVIDSLPNLKLIAARSTGFDHIDLAHATEKGIAVVNVPVYGESTVAEFAFALLLTITKKIIQASTSVKITEKFSREGLAGWDLKGKTFGVIGTGHIGVSAIKIAKGFEMEVVAFDAFPNQELSEKLGFKYMSLEELFSKSDFISLHVPFLPSTNHLINQKNISFIKRGAVLINTSRGEIVETEALIHGLETGIVGAAGLDVLENEIALRIGESVDEEKAKLNDRLIEMSNVIVTPHNASNTKEAMDRIRQTSVDNIKAFQNSAPINLVKPKV
jgi:D-lactate dehydrogenase